MKNYTELFLFIMEKEQELIKQIVQQAKDGNPQAVLTNAAHGVVAEILARASEILKKNKPAERPKLRLVK